MPIIKTEQLRKVYPVSVKEPGLRGTVSHLIRRKKRLIQAVSDVSFEIEPGEVVGFLGPNGAGKTTTLKMLTGLIHPSAGSLSVANHEPFQRRADFLSQITLVMGQKQQLLWDLPAIDSLRINGTVYGLDTPEFNRRVGELTEMLSLEGKLHQPVRKLSLGERMKAELMAALLHQPQILFLDEPTLGLDVNAQVSVRQFLRDYNERYGATILLTSHYMADITALCDRVLLIHCGKMIYDGELEGLFEQFAPYREVTVELEIPQSETQLENYGEIEELNGCQVKLIVRREKLTTSVSNLLADFKVLDLTVSDPPIEEIIGRVFREGAVIS